MTIETLAQAKQTIGVRRCGTNLDGRSLTVKQMEVETLAAEIRTGVQHETGLLSIAPRRQAGACHCGGPSPWHSLPSHAQSVVPVSYPALLSVLKTANRERGCD